MINPHSFPTSPTASRDLSSLPTTGPWEVGVLVTPEAGPDVDGMLLVVDADSGRLRYAEPLVAGASLGPLLAAAAAAPPAPRTPGRPSALKVRSSLLPLIAPVAAVLGAPLQVVEALPGVDAAGEELLAASHLPLPRAPEAWEPLMGRLLTSPPWNVVTDAVRFQFPDEPSLAGWVAVVVGAAGGEKGVMLFPSPKDLDAFLDWCVHRVIGSSSFDAWGLNLDPHEVLPPRAVQLLTGVGLADSSVALHIFGFDGSAARLLQPEEEILFARAVEAVLGLVDQERAALLDRPARRSVPTGSGPLLVASSGSERRSPSATTPPRIDPHRPSPASPQRDDSSSRGPRILVDVPHRAMTTTVYTGEETIEGVVLKLNRRDIPTIARRLAGVDRVQLQPMGDIDALVAYCGDVEVGVVSFFQWGRDAWARIRAARGGLLILSGGGPHATSLSVEDIQCAVKVAWVDRV